MDEYRKGWALRYLREAVDELKIAERNSRALNLILDAVRKAQAAIYCSLGDPVFIQYIVNEALERSPSIESPILRCLVEIEKSIKQIENVYPSAGELALKESNRIILIASKIVNLLIQGD